MAHRLIQNLREEVAMDVDEDDEGSQDIKRVPDYGIEVDFSSLDDDEKEVSASQRDSLTCSINSGVQDGSSERLAELDESIAKLSADIEKMAPNLKAMERCALLHFATTTCSSRYRLDDVENKLLETEREAEKARKESKTARDAFNDIKKRRYAHSVSHLIR